MQIPSIIGPARLTFFRSIFLTGWGMSQHAQALMISTRVFLNSPSVFGSRLSDHFLLRSMQCLVIRLCWPASLALSKSVSSCPRMLRTAPTTTITANTHWLTVPAPDRNCPQRQQLRGLSAILRLS